MTADLDGLPFAIVRRGFDRAQVEERLSKLLSERDSAHTARQNAVADRERISRELDVSRGETRAARSELAETRAEVDRLAGQVAELSTIPNTVDGMSDRLQQMVRVAQDEVNDMRARATRGAAQILSMAQAEADELRESSRQERRTFEAEQRSAQDELHARLEETPHAAGGRCARRPTAQRARLDAELAERRARDEQTLAAELADRREVMLADLASQEKRQREEAQRIVDAASTRARALVADAAADTDRARSHAREQVVRANEELEQLRALQHQVAEQLAGVRQPAGLDAAADQPGGRPGARRGHGRVPPRRDAGPVPDGVADAVVPRAAGRDGAGGRRPGRPRRAPVLDDDRDAPEYGSAADERPVGLRRAGRRLPGVRRDGVPTRCGTTASGSDGDGVRRDLDAGADAVDRDDDGRTEPAADSRSRRRPRGTRIPQPRDADQAETAGRPSPVARSGHRAGARR